MNEPLIEGVGCGIGLVLLYYFQVWRPGREEARARAQEKTEEKTEEKTGEQATLNEPQPPGSPNV